MSAVSQSDLRLTRHIIKHGDSDAENTHLEASEQDFKNQWVTSECPSLSKLPMCMRAKTAS